MLSLHVNWSDSLQQLLSEGRVSVGGIKVSNLVGHFLGARKFISTHKTRTGRQLSLHVHFANSTENVLRPHDVLDIEGYLKASDTSFVNTHFIVPTEKALLAQSLERSHSHISRLVELFGKDRVVLEMIPEKPEVIEFNCYVEQFSELVLEHNIGVILDLAHTRMTALRRKVALADYLPKFPLERVVILHTTGLGLRNGRTIDHCPMDEEDFASLQDALWGELSSRLRNVRFVEHEYGGIGGWFEENSDVEVLEREILRLTALLSSAR